jgi:hypothetical protein
MKRIMQRCVAIVGVLLVFAAVRVYAAGASADLKIIVNADNPLAVEARDLENYFLANQRYWADGTSILPFNAPRATDQRRWFDQAVLRLTPDEAARYWLDKRIRSGTSAPRESNSDALTIKLVGNLKGAIAYVPASTDTAGVRVIARVHDGKVLLP